MGLRIGLAWFIMFTWITKLLFITLAVPWATGVSCTYLMELYMSKLPPKAVEKDMFYCKPAKSAVNGKPWYHETAVGHNTYIEKETERYVSWSWFGYQITVWGLLVCLEYTTILEAKHCQTRKKRTLLIK